MNVTKKSAVLLLGIIVILVMASVQPVDAATQVAYVGSGTGSSGTGTTVTPSYPTSPTEGDLFLCVILSNRNDDRLIGVTDFAPLFGPYQMASSEYGWVYYKYSDGTETGTTSVNRPYAGYGFGAKIYSFENVHQTIGSAYEDVSYTNLGSTDDIYDEAVTTSGTLSLAINIVWIGEDGNDPIDFAGETGGDWTQVEPEWEYPDAQDGAIDVQSAVMATSGTVDGGYYDMGSPDPCGVMGFALMPADDGGTAYTAYPDGDLTLTGSPSLIADFVKTLVEGFALTGTTSLVAAFIKTLVEGFALTGTTSIFLIIQKLIQEGFALTGGTSLVANYSVLLAAGFTLTGITSLVTNYSVRLSVGLTLAGVTSLFAGFVKTLIEGVSLVGTTNVFLIIQKLIQEGFALTGGTSLVVNFSVVLASGFALAGVTSLIANFSVRLSVGFTLGGAIAAAASYVKTLIEGFSLGGTVSAFKVFVVELVEGFSLGVGITVTKIVGVSLIGSMFFQLFFGLDMWGYLGPLGLVIVGYVVANKDKNLGVLMFVVESLIIANYLLLVAETPEYWWHTFILLIGCISTLMYSLWDR